MWDAAVDPCVRRRASLPCEVCGGTLCQALQDISEMIIMNSSKFKPGLPSSFRKLNFPNDQPRFAVDGTDNFSQTNQEYTPSPTNADLVSLYIYISNLADPRRRCRRNVKPFVKRCARARSAVCLGYSPLRLANGGEDKLHLNDVIISDTASCNQGQGAEREIRREVLYAWIGRRSENAVLFICLLSLPPRLERRRNTKESRGESGAQNKTKDDNGGAVWPAVSARRASRGEARAARDLCHSGE